ncbi:MAG: ABC transporter permease [Bacilli bacterium]
MVKTRFNLFQVVTMLALAFMVIFLWQFIPPLFASPGPMWTWMQQYWFPDVLFETLGLVMGAVLLSLIIGVSLGYWMSFYRLPLARLWDILLVLPLAMPAYLLGYIYGFLFAGPWQNPWVVITNMPGAIFIFSLTLYPYVYLATRSFLSKQPQGMYSAAKSLGSHPFSMFWRIVFPLMRPAMVGASVLVAMEVINDYGLVQYFGLRVYSTTIFQSWFNGNDLNTAVRFSFQLILVIVVILWLEASLRKSFKYSYATTQIKPLMKAKLPATSAWLFYGLALLTVGLAIGIPLFQMISWLPAVPTRIFNEVYWDGFLSTILMAFYPTIIILVLALCIANFQRVFPRPWKKWLQRMLTLGYALPGAVIAVGMMLMWVPVDQFFLSVFGVDRLWISGSLMLLTMALILRFFAVANQLIESTYHKIGMKYTQASYGLGRPPLKTLIAVDLPLISHGVVAAGLIVMVDLFKELPLTLILRPFNFHTLATYLYQYAGDEQINVASPMALTLVALTAFAVALASDMILKVNTYES